jgi:hypothetical protein
MSIDGPQQHAVIQAKRQTEAHERRKSKTILQGKIRRKITNKVNKKNQGIQEYVIY